ncbi:unnamed protein product, partial [Adineta steineri]
SFTGNPKDGIHLSRRPDVLLASTGSRGLYKFGLLICKRLSGIIRFADGQTFKQKRYY